MSTESRARGADRRFYGVAEAIVTDVNDPEKEGRVKLRFPWFDESMESEWCRVAQPYAGSGFGYVWVPELDQEVLVAFIHGDMRKPVVVGGLYNGVDKPPTYRDGSRDEKMIRTKAGHELLMKDTSGQEQLRILTQGGHSLDLNDQQQKIVLTSTGGHKITLDDAAGKISIETSSGQSVTLDSSSVTVQAAATVTLNAPSVKLGAGAQSLVLGETLLASFNAHTHNCTAPGTPSGPPVPPLTSAVLSVVSKTG